MARHDDAIRQRRRRLLLLTVLGGGGEGVVYTLRDMFTTDRAAGAVNGTLSEPSGHARTVTDTGSKLSITGGKVSVATGGAFADPSMWYPSQARVAGLMLFASVTCTTNAVALGFDTNQAAQIAFAIVLNVAGPLTVYDSAVSKVVGAGIATGVTYSFAIVLRGTGCFFFIKGGVFTNWTLIWISVTSSASVFPSFQNASTTDVYTIDDVRIPNALYIPPPLAYDTFTRANGALGSTEIAGPDAQVITALAWAFVTGIWTITTNRANGTPTLGADAIVNGAFAADTNWTKGAGWTIAAGVGTGTATSGDLTQAVAPLIVGRWYRVVFILSGFAAGTVGAVLGGAALVVHNTNATHTDTGRAGTTAFLMRGAGFTGNLDDVQAFLLATADLFASVTVSTADVIAEVGVTLAATLGVQAGLVLNLDSDSNPQNFVLAYLDGKGNCVLEECVAGVYTTKFTTAITYSAGAILRVIRDGTSCRVFYNNLAVSTVQTMTANANVRHGIFSTRSNSFLDGFAVWAYGKSSNPYSILDGY